MEKKCMVVAAVLALTTITLSAQVKHTVAKPQVKTKAIATKVDKQMAEKLVQMETATQKIVFVDSIVVDKKDFLRNYILNPESGSLGKYDDVFNTHEQANAYVYVNEVGDRCYYSLEDTVGNFELCMSDLINGERTTTSVLDGIDVENTYLEVNYPFMMADGTTFYFAAKGKESIGGYDIFVTRYDSEKGIFLKPENIGMPFNSPANDYMYAIDEYGNIGWFATDRGQKVGKVCLYMFIPPTTRETYQVGKYTEKQIKSFAALHSIADTWGDGTEREAALVRIKSVPLRREKQTEKPAFTFVVNDVDTYHWYNDFKVKSNIAKFRQLQDQRRKLKTLEGVIEKSREDYANASDAERKAMADELVRSEQQCELYEAGVIQLEKDIRNSENRALGYGQ